MRIQAVEHVLPSKLVSNDDLIEAVLANSAFQSVDSSTSLRKAIEKFFARTGAQTRYHRQASERAIDLGVAAGRLALATAKVVPGDIDLLVYTGVGRGALEPAAANAFQHALGLSKATCFDLLDACASWLRAFDLAHHYLEVGAAARIMILNCECNVVEYQRLDFRGPADIHDLGAGLTIGEAATATIVERADDRNEYRASFRTNGEHFGLCQIPLPHIGQFDPVGSQPEYPSLKFYARSGDLHRVGMAQLVDQWNADPYFAQSTPDVVFTHSVSVPTSQAALQGLRLDPRTLVDTFPSYGNTVSASVPLAMSLAIREGRLRRGHEVVAAIGSAGLTTAICRFRY